ncbi:MULTISPECIES: hypothetical protein [Acetomicrobium]|jgi:hypothetical protein|nr:MULTISPECIES: hypothetical protein [Acetomicrobium]MDR9769406.1 hypothetical protein [Acetomicrobium sp.]
MFTNENNIEDSFKFDWEGGLSDANIKISSVDLQHKALDWR